MKKHCSITDCNNPIFSDGYCSKHYMRVKRHGDPTAIRPYATNKQKCIVLGCTRFRLAKGYCHKHYYRHLRYGSTANRINPGNIIDGIKKIDREILKKALQELPERDRTILLKRFENKESFQKIADSFGLSKQGVRQIILKTKRILKAKYYLYNCA